MKYLLDANACIHVLNNTSPELIARLRQEDSQDIGISSVVRAELNYGARRSQRVIENLKVLSQFCAAFATLSFDDRAAEEYGQIRADLARIGKPIGPNDLLIAATARAHDLTLITHNVAEFSRVVGLKLEDWEVGPATAGE